MSAILDATENTSVRHSAAVRRNWNPARLARVAARFVSVLVCVGIWQVLAEHHVSFGLVTFANVPAPSDVVPAAGALFHSPKLPMHLLSSVMRVLVGFVAASAVGIGLGLAIGRYRAFEDAVLPPLEVLRPIPAVAWIPLAILMFLHRR